jgi:hypothetical protein
METPTQSEVKPGQIWREATDNPFDALVVKIIAVKNGYCQYAIKLSSGGWSENLSSCHIADNFLLRYKLDTEAAT